MTLRLFSCKIRQEFCNRRQGVFELWMALVSMFYFSETRGVYERITASNRDFYCEPIGGTDGWVPADKPKTPLHPPIIPPPVGEVTDEEEKAWRRELQAAEALMELGLDDV